MGFAVLLRVMRGCWRSGDGIPSLRWAQQGSTAPWTGPHAEQLPKVAMTVGIDLSDPVSRTIVENSWPRFPSIDRENAAKNSQH